MARENWVDLTTIDNNTPIYNVAWKNGGFSNINDTWFSEASGLNCDTLVDSQDGWREGTTEAYGYWKWHRFSSRYSGFTCTFVPEGRVGNGVNLGYGVSLADNVINTLPAKVINGETYYELGIVNWQNWKPLYMPLSTSKIQSTYIEGKILVDIASKYSTIDTDVTELSGPYETSSYTVNLSSDYAWTATTIPSWVSLSSTAGTSGDTEITVTFRKNNIYSQRTGTIVFTNTETDTAEVECTQEKHPLLVPKNNIYRGGNRIN